MCYHGSLLHIPHRETVQTICSADDAVRKVLLCASFDRSRFTSSFIRLHCTQDHRSMRSKWYPSMWRGTALFVSLRLPLIFAQGYYPFCAGVWSLIADGYCDTSLNNSECEWDGGDCCYCTCEDGPTYNCGSYSFYDCQDADAWCYTATPTPSPSPPPSPAPSCTGPPDYISDGVCDASTNNAVSCMTRGVRQPIFGDLSRGRRRSHFGRESDRVLDRSPIVQVSKCPQIIRSFNAGVQLRRRRLLRVHL